MGTREGVTRRRVRALRERVGQAMSERGVPGADALEGLSDAELADLDSVLQVAHFVLYRRDASARAQRIMEQVVELAEGAAAEAEGARGRTDELLARAEAAVGRMREHHWRSAGVSREGRA